VRSYFSGDVRRKIGALLRETQHVDHIVCRHPLEAAVLEVRLIHEHRPRFNRQARDALYLGPLSSTRQATRVVEAIETAAPLRRCTVKPSAKPRESPCAPAQLGVATCPCSGQIGEADYGDIVGTVVQGLTTDPEILLAPLRARMRTLAESERFEEAADMRERAAALAQAVKRQRRLDALVRAGRLVVEVHGHGGAELVHGQLVRAWASGASAQPSLLDLPGTCGPPEPDRLVPDRPVPKDLADELHCVASWLDERAPRVRIVHCDEGLASRLPVVPSFTPAGRRDAEPGRR
jgi:DNA polymerase-3 subunit epsilon